MVSSTSVVHTGLSPPGGAGGGVIHQRRTHRPIPSRWGGGWCHPPASYTPAYPLQVGRGVVSSTSVVHTGLSPPGGAGGWCHPPASYTPAYPLQVGRGGGVIHQRRTHRPIPSRWGGGWCHPPASYTPAYPLQVGRGVVSSTSVVHTGLSPPGGAGGGVIHQRRTHRPIPSRWGGGWCHPPASYTPAYPLQVGWVVVSSTSVVHTGLSPPGGHVMSGQMWGHSGFCPASPLPSEFLGVGHSCLPLATGASQQVPHHQLAHHLNNVNMSLYPKYNGIQWTNR